MKYSQRPKYERRNETIAVLVMILLCIPVLFIYFSFFANAFILDSTGELTLQNFQFLYQPIQLSQYTVEPIGKAFRNTVIFTAIATTLEVTMSAWSNYLLFNVLIFNTKTPVLATYLRVLSRNDQMIADYGVFAAMAMVYMLPVLIFFFISQRQLMQGTISGGKGI